MGYGYQTTIRRKLGLTPDVRATLTKQHKKNVKMFDRAVRVFVETLAEEVSRHQDTGMSYASLFKLSRQVKAEIPPSSPARERRKGLTLITGTYIPSGFKDRKLGEKLGEKSYKLQYGAPNNPRYNFVFEIQVYQYFINEYGLGFTKPGGAWESVGQAVSAMEAFLKKYFKQFVPTAESLFRETGKGVIEPAIQFED